MAPRTKPEQFDYPNGQLPQSFSINLAAQRTLQRGWCHVSMAEQFLKRNWPKDTSDYIEKNRLAEILEPILVELLLRGADRYNPREFLLQKLKEIQRIGLDGVKWNTFVPEVTPDPRSMAVKARDEIERLDDYGPSEEKFYVDAFNFRYRKLKAQLLQLWQMYVEKIKEQRIIDAIKNSMAQAHLEKKLLKKAVKGWGDRTRLQESRNHEASKRLAKVYCLHFGKFYVEAWDAFTKQSLKTKRYFDQIEKGEIEDYNALLANNEADAIYRLPRAIAIKIFRNLNIEDLSICRGVSREWNIMTQSPSLWATIDYSICRHRVSNYAAKRHAEIARLYLSTLNLGMTVLELSAYRAFSMCRNVQHLSLSGCRYLSDEQAIVLLEGFKALLTLDLSYTPIGDTTIRALSKYGTNLQVLNLAYCTGFTTKGLIYLASGEGCRMLKFLDMSGCLQVSTAGFAALANILQYLKSLILNDLYSLEDEGVQIFLTKAKGLEELSLMSAGRLSNFAFKDLQHNTQLRKFAFSKNFKVSDMPLSNSFRFCAQLSEITINHCPQVSDGVMKSLGGLRSLRSVDVSSCCSITDAGVRHLVDGNSGPHLTHLVLSSIDNLTDVALYRITSRCQRLIYLDVNYNERLTDSGFELVPGLSRLQEFHCRGTMIGSYGAAVIGKIVSIRKLDFSECQRLEDLEKITKNFNPVLTHVSFSIIKGLSNNGVKHLAFNCRNLESISISGCPQLSDVAVQYIAGVCRHLRHIDISGIPYVSDRSLKYIRKGCRSMNHLVAKYSSSMTKDSIEKARKWFRRVEFNTEDAPLWWQEAYERSDRLLEHPDGWPTASQSDPVSKSVNELHRPKPSTTLPDRPQTTIGIPDTLKVVKADELLRLRFSIAESPEYCLGKYRQLRRDQKRPRRVKNSFRPRTAPMTPPLPSIRQRPRSQMSM